MYLDTEKRLTKLEALVKFRNEIFSINTSSVVPPAFTSFIKKHDRIISIRENVLAIKTNFTSPLFMKVAAPRQDSERSCICVLGVCHFSIGLWNFFDNVIRCFCLQLSVEYFAVSNVVFCCFVFVCFVLLRLVQLKLTIYNILICLVKAINILASRDIWIDWFSNLFDYECLVALYYKRWVMRNKFSIYSFISYEKPIKKMKCIMVKIKRTKGQTRKIQHRKLKIEQLEHH